MGGITEVVRRSSDQTLARVFSSRPARRLLVASVARSIPRRSEGNLDGCVQIDLVRPATRRHDKRIEPWVFELHDGTAKARRGEATDPQLRASVSLSDFVRIAAGEVDPMTLVFDRRIDLQGSFKLARRLSALSGAESL